MNSEKKAIKELKEKIALLENALKFKNDREKLDFEMSLIQSEFMDIIHELMQEQEEKISKKALASGLDSTASYVTQLFNYNKKINLTVIAKLQRVFNTKFRLREQKEAKLFIIKKPNIEKMDTRNSTETYKVNEGESVGMV